MRCLDASFVIDLVRGEAAAVRKAKALEESGERLSIASPAVAEVLLGAYFKGGAVLTETMALVSSLEVLEVDEGVAAEAGRMGAELLRRGVSAGTVDLLIAAASKLNNQILVTRDAIFSWFPDVAVEGY